jgi:F-type H+-transporting ATPase subunit delta
LKANVVSKRYAIALYDVAKESGNLENLIKEYASFVDSCKKNNDFYEFIMNPLISKEDKISVFTKLKGRSITEGLYVFLVLLARKNRLPILIDVYEVLKSLYMEEKGEVEAEVSVAIELSKSELNELQKVLSKVTGKKVSINVKLDPSIYGGLIAKVGSDLFDASIKGQLDRFRENIIR